MKVIRVNASSSYDVVVGENLIDNVGEWIDVKKCKFCVVTDSIVNLLYADTVCASLEKKGYSVYKFVFEQGEKSKNLQTYSNIINYLAENKFDKRDCLLALGGGVVGDLTGFVAATYLRGIRFIQVPTTLLSQIDSSVGGKTAVDLPCGKNLVGAFYQPYVVLCDVSVLNRLPKSVFACGMGEVAKYAMLDKKIFSLIVDNAPLQDIVTACIECKKNIVEVDEFDKGDRKLLNLGHTFAHAIETLSDFKISHGEAVGMGVKIMLDCAYKQGYMSVNEYNRAKNAVIKCVGERVCPYSKDELCSVISYDKKKSGDKISLVEIRSIGDCRIKEMDISLVKEYVF